MPLPGILGLPGDAVVSRRAAAPRKRCRADRFQRRPDGSVQSNRSLARYSEACASSTPDRPRAPRHLRARSAALIEAASACVACVAPIGARARATYRSIKKPCHRLARAGTSTRAWARARAVSGSLGNDAGTKFSCGTRKVDRGGASGLSRSEVGALGSDPSGVYSR